MIKAIIVCFVIYILIGAVLVSLAFLGMKAAAEEGDPFAYDSMRELAKISAKVTGSDPDATIRTIFFQNAILWPRLIFRKHKSREELEADYDRIRELSKEIDNKRNAVERVMKEAERIRTIMDEAKREDTE